MSNKVEKELQDATEVAPKKGEDRTDYLMRLMKAVAALTQEGWDGLSAEGQEWYNKNADARNAAKKAGKPVPDPLDFEAEEEEAPKRRRASAEEEEPAKEEKAAKPSLEDLEEGQRFKITTTRGKTIEGTVVKNSAKKENLVYKDADGDEDDIDYEKVSALEVLHGSAGKEDGETGGGAAEPEVGDVVEITTKRGKTFTAKLVELNDDDLVYEDDDGKDDISRDRVESIKVVTKGKPAAAKKPTKEEPAEKPSKGKTKEEPAEGEEIKRTRTTNPDGVSVGQVIKELVAEDLEATEEEIAKALKKRGVEFKENTLHLNYVECHKFVKVLRDKKHIKAAK